MSFSGPGFVINSLNNKIKTVKDKKDFTDFALLPESDSLHPVGIPLFIGSSSRSHFMLSSFSHFLMSEHNMV